MKNYDALFEELESEIMLLQGQLLESATFIEDSKACLERKEFKNGMVGFDIGSAMLLNIKENLFNCEEKIKKIKNTIAKIK